MGIGNWFTSGNIAELFGISERRVRQLPSAELPAEVVGPRTTLYHRSDVEALAARRRGSLTSVPFRGLGPASEPAGLMLDAVLSYSTGWSVKEPGRVHVRVWRRGQADGGQHVVVFGYLDGETVAPRNWWNQVLTVLEDRVPELDLARSTFVEYEAQRTPYVVQQFGAVNFSRERKDTHGSPSVPLTCEDLEEVIGDRFYGFAAGTYTPENVEAWKRLRARLRDEVTPIEIVVDANRALPVLGYAKALAAAVEANPDDPYLGPAATRAALDAETRFRPPAVTSTRDHLGLDDHGDGPTKFATRAVPPVLDPADVEWLTRWKDLYPDPASLEACEAGIDSLYLRQLACDEYADPGDRDPLLHDALGYAIDIYVSFLARQYDDHFEDPGPIASVRAYEATPEVRTYLRGVQFDTRGTPTVPSTPAERRLAAALDTTGRREPVECEFGLDPWGRQIALATKFGKPWFAVQWPGRIHDDVLPAGSRIVADGDVGDRPVFIRRPDGKTDLLPHRGESHDDQWNFGYSGTGPGALAHSIGRVLSLPFEAGLARNFLDRLVSEADEDHLDLSVNEIRAAIAVMPHDTDS